MLQYLISEFYFIHYSHKNINLDKNSLSNNICVNAYLYWGVYCGCIVGW